MKRCHHLVVAILIVVGFSVPLPSHSQECFQVDFLDFGDVKTCAGDDIRLPQREHYEPTRYAAVECTDPQLCAGDDIRLPQRERYEPTRYAAVECTDPQLFFTEKLPVLFECTIQSWKWSSESEAIADMKDAAVRVVEELDKSRAVEFRKHLKYVDGRRSPLSCTSYARSIPRGLEQCFNEACSCTCNTKFDTCADKLTHMFTCLIDRAFCMLNNKDKRSLACKMLDTIYRPFARSGPIELAHDLDPIMKSCQREESSYRNWRFKNFPTCPREPENQYCKCWQNIRGWRFGSSCRHPNSLRSSLQL